MYFFLELFFTVSKSAFVAVLAGSSLRETGAQLSLLLNLVVSGEESSVVLESIGIAFLFHESGLLLEYLTILLTKLRAGMEAGLVRSHLLHMRWIELCYILRPSLDEFVQRNLRLEVRVNRISDVPMAFIFLVKLRLGLF